MLLIFLEVIGNPKIEKTLRKNSTTANFAISLSTRALF